MSKQNSIKHVSLVRRLIAGILMGVANAIPGVSGGTVAVITGVYKSILDNISTFFNSGKQMKQNFLYLLPLGIGVLVGVLFTLDRIDFLLKSYTLPTKYLFLGLVAGSCPYLWDITRKDKPTVPRLIFLAIGLILMILSLIGGRGISQYGSITSFSVINIIVLFLAGVAASGVMLIPGVSGSFLLLLLGLYQTVTSIVAGRDFLLLIPFVLGCIVGFFTVAKLISRLLRTSRAPTMYTIFGLVLGSLLLLGYDVLPAPFNGGDTTTIIVCVVCFLAGALLAFFTSPKNEGI